MQPMSSSWTQYSPNAASFWRHKNIFVTGCTGLMGAWLTEALVALGANVVGLMRDKTADSHLSFSGTINHITLVRGELGDYPLMERIIAEYEIDTIFHLAAQTIVGVANRAPLSTFETNIRGTWILLEAARTNPTVKRIVLASSDQVYGSQATLPFHEGLPLNGLYPYDVSKVCADLIGRSYAQTYDLPVVVTRCANFYGGGDLNWSRIIPGTIRSVLQGERPIIRSDGRFLRDYMYVKDAVRGHLMAAEALSKDRNIYGEAFNFGCEQPVSALDMVQRIIAHSPHKTIEPKILNTTQNEVPTKYLAAEKARVTLGWQPHFSLDEGLHETIDWYTQWFQAEMA